MVPFLIRLPLLLSVPLRVRSKRPGIVSAPLSTTLLVRVDTALSGSREPPVTVMVPLPMEAAEASTTLPALRLKPPLKLLAPVRVRVPVPSLFSAPLPPIVPDRVRVLVLPETPSLVPVMSMTLLSVTVEAPARNSPPAPALVMLPLPRAASLLIDRMPPLSTVDVVPVNTAPDIAQVPASTIRLLKFLKLSLEMFPLPLLPVPPPTAFCRARMLFVPIPPSTTPAAAKLALCPWIANASAVPVPFSTTEPVIALKRLTPPAAPMDRLPVNLSMLVNVLPVAEAANEIRPVIVPLLVITT